MMWEQWMPALRLAMSQEEFRQLPRHPAYKYEYLDGKALLTPRPRFYHARLDLAQYQLPDDLALPGGISLRPAQESDFVDLQKVFSAAFSQRQPFAGLSDGQKQDAVSYCLERTRSGGDGLWLSRASFVAIDATKESLGAIFLTQIYPDHPHLDSSMSWSGATEAQRDKMGRAHLTWIFVQPERSGQGIGSALLARAVLALREMGFAELLTTFLLGNESSLLWHWRNGFELLSAPYSLRSLRQMPRE